MFVHPLPASRLPVLGSPSTSPVFPMACRSSLPATMLSVIFGPATSYDETELYTELCMLYIYIRGKLLQ